MHLAHFLTLISYLCLLLTGFAIGIPYGNSLSPQKSEQQLSHHPRYIRPRVLTDGSPTKTITLYTLTHRTTFTWLAAYIPSRIAAESLVKIYHEILYQCSSKGEWFNSAPLERVVLRAKDVYLVFTATDPQVPVPWQLVKEWAEAMEHSIDMNGFIGPYVATFERLVGDRIVDFWVQLGIGTPPALAAAAA
ncbi:MAG: hypothetical protein Q9218_002114 [Villophora microphyllina]